MTLFFVSGDYVRLVTGEEDRRHARHNTSQEIPDLESRQAALLIRRVRVEPGGVILHHTTNDLLLAWESGRIQATNRYAWYERPLVW